MYHIFNKIKKVLMIAVLCIIFVLLIFYIINIYKVNKSAFHQKTEYFKMNEIVSLDNNFFLIPLKIPKGIQFV